jgi:hypothetical protein
MVIIISMYQVFNATFNNISVLLLEETRVPGENHQPVASHWQTWSHNDVPSAPRLSRIWTHNISGFNREHSSHSTIMKTPLFQNNLGQLWSWSYSSWRYNYLGNQYLSPLMLWVQILLRRGALGTSLCDQVFDPSYNTDTRVNLISRTTRPVL